MVVQTNMHPQVVEEAGKPLYFFPHPKNETQETANGWKSGKKTFKSFL